MGFLRLLRFLRGYVRFSVRSGSAERFLNICAHRGIACWGCSKCGGTFSAYTTVGGYRRMRGIAKKACVRTRINGRYGLPFLCYRYRRRIGITVGAVLFCVLLALSQQFVWVVRVEGCQRTDSRQIVQALEVLGVRRGVWKHSIDPRQIRQQILIQVDELSWATLNLQGTTAKLLVRERTLPPPKIDTKVPANVVAARDGQIKKLEVTDGRALVKVGDTVRAGDIIVSGVLQDRWGMTHLVRAGARVVAHVPETLEVEVPLRQKTAVLTGEVVKRRYLEVAGVRIPLFIYSGMDGPCKVERMRRAPELCGVRLPFEITRETYIFYEEQTGVIGQEMALRLARRELERKERRTFGDAVLSRELSGKVEQGILTLRAEYLIESDIAKQAEIPVLDRQEQEKPRKPRDAGY